MTPRANDVMTRDPACCTSGMTLDQVAQLMVNNDCGEIPVVDGDGRPIGVVTDRDIVCRVVAEGKNPIGHLVQECMSRPAVTVRSDASLDEILSTMETRQIRRIPVVDERGRCVGIIAQADVARMGAEQVVAELVREVSAESGQKSR